MFFSTISDHYLASTLYQTQDRRQTWSVHLQRHVIWSVKPCLSTLSINTSALDIAALNTVVHFSKWHQPIYIYTRFLFCLLCIDSHYFQRFNHTERSLRCAVFLAILSINFSISKEISLLFYLNRQLLWQYNPMKTMDDDHQTTLRWTSVETVSDDLNIHKESVSSVL